jgi:Nif-specific ferredoxin III
VYQQQGEQFVAQLTGLTLGGKTWTPQFVQEINQDKCIGCGRCFKACGRDVLLLKALNEDGEFVENEEDEEIERKVMTVAHAELCIGCQACARICPKNCYTHAPLATN